MLVTLLATTGLLSALVLSMALVGLQESRAAQAQVAQLQAYYVAEGKIDRIVRELRDGTLSALPIKTPVLVGSLFGDSGSNGDTIEDLGGDAPVRLTVTGTAHDGATAQTLTAYVRTRMPGFIFDTLVYTPEFHSSDISWVGDDRDGEEPFGTPENDKGNIWTSQERHNWVSNSTDLDPIANAGFTRDENSYGGVVGAADIINDTYINTRVIVDGSVFPVPRFRLEGASGLRQRAMEQIQRNPLTGVVQRDAEGNPKNNYYSVDRINTINAGQETFPAEFWYPKFDPVTDPLTHEPIIDPLTREPILKRRATDPTNDEANIVLLDFVKPTNLRSRSGVDLKIAQPATGGFVVIAGDEKAKIVNLTSGALMDPADEQVKRTQRQLDTIFYTHNRIGTYLEMDGAVDTFIRGALWGGSRFDFFVYTTGPVSATNRVTATYSQIYTDALRRMNLPAEIQVLAVKSGRDVGTGSGGGGPGENGDGTVGALADDLTEQLPPAGQSALHDTNQTGHDARTAADNAGAPPSAGHTADDAVTTARQQHVPQAPNLP